ncbi:hypothetical protein D3C72_1142520 [compost metagenome]
MALPGPQADMAVGADHQQHGIADAEPVGHGGFQVGVHVRHPGIRRDGDDGFDDGAIGQRLHVAP